ncbi:MAG: DUF4340 domain-containing protein [Oscillibacter sp.]|nr:DUF4340 domain-containing protein [Oscillibacter sp.]
MTWKERRTVTILLCIAGGLFLALLIVFGMIYREEREEALAETSGAAGLASAGAPADSGAYTALRYYNGSATLSFALDETGKWIWADGPDFPLREDTVVTMIETLTSLKFQQVLPAGESREEYGLDTPSATLTATAGTGEQTLAFGKTTTDGDSYYMMMNGDESTVYIVADTLVKLMGMPIYDMCALPELPDLSEGNLRAITIQGAAPAPETPEEEEAAEEPERPTVTLNARHSAGEDQPALWFESSDNVTASPLLQDLLHDLKTMAIARCVDYFPSDEAAEICGFANPDAILKVEYTAGGTDQTFTLFVGTRMPDQSGRYVRLEEDGAIYALATGDVDALMTISVAGMRGPSSEEESE